MTNYGWKYMAVNPQGKQTAVYPAVGGSLSYDSGRSVSKTIRDVVFLPDELRKIGLTRDQLQLWYVEDGVETLMGFYAATEQVTQKAVLLDPETNLVSDLSTIGFGDRMALLIRSDGQSQVVQAGFDPTQVAIDLLSFVGIPYSWQGTASMGGETIVWDGSVTLLDKVTQLSQLAGHRPPWMSNEGVVTSVVASTPSTYEPNIVAVNDLDVEASSLVVTENYLTAPNVVVVTGNSGSRISPVTGRWDAPSITPHSFANRGYYYTQMISRQGVRDEQHAEAIAEAIGEQNSARTLAFRCRPTTRIDGPSVLRYDGSLWVTSSYSIDLGPMGMMDVTAEELVDPFFNTVTASQIGVL